MLINILLLVLVFGATRWRKQPYAGALVIAMIKGALYAIAASAAGAVWWGVVVNALIGFILFGGLAAGMVFLFRRLDQREPITSNYSTRGSDRMTFRWEYVPLAAIVLILIFGEMVVSSLTRGR